MRGSDSGYALGTSGSPQTTFEQAEYAIVVADNEAKLKYEADNAPLLDENLIEELRQSDAKFSREKMIFVTRDATGQIVWLEEGNKAAGLNHLKARGHIEQLAKHFGIDEKAVPRVLRNVIRDGKLISNKLVNRGGRDGYERKYEYDGKHIVLAAIGTNGFLVTVYPDD